MRPRNLLRGIVAATAASTVLAGLGPLQSAEGVTVGTVAPDSPRGAVVAAAPLDRDLWIPETTRKAFTLTYVTSNTFGDKALSTGTLFIPKGTAPAGGWPVISWAHGTSGLADACAPSRTGPALPERDWAYLGAWMKQGYAIVASDYAGLGTPGLHAYLDGRTTAHNVVDIVKAGRSYTRTHLPAGQRLSRKWVTIGQSQGAGASIYTARYATKFGGPGLDYRGAVGTGVPANIETTVLLLGPAAPPVPMPKGITAYMSLIFASLRYAHPELGIDGILTDAGRRALRLAKTTCTFELEEKLDGEVIGSWFTAPVLTLPGFASTVRDYMAMPTSGFDKPFFMGHGLLDTDVPVAVTLPYVTQLTLGLEPVTFKLYPTDHSGTMLASQPDSIPFVKRLFAG
jgi:hypothetical protein